MPNYNRFDANCYLKATCNILVFGYFPNLCLVDNKYDFNGLKIKLGIKTDLKPKKHVTVWNRIRHTPIIQYPTIVISKPSKL